MKVLDIKFHEATLSRIYAIVLYRNTYFVRTPYFHLNDEMLHLFLIAIIIIGLSVIVTIYEPYSLNLKII